MINELFQDELWVEAGNHLLFWIFVYEESLGKSLYLQQKSPDQTNILYIKINMTLYQNKHDPTSRQTAHCIKKPLTNL